MSIELARTFLEVVGSGSLAGAAERLNLTHSAITMRIKSLEQLMGRRLLVRPGYEAIGAFVPFPSRRGLVFIDPPYEKDDEASGLLAQLEQQWRGVG